VLHLDKKIIEFDEILFWDMHKELSGELTFYSCPSNVIYTNFTPNFTDSLENDLSYKAPVPEPIAFL
jgi:hypothetical protein